jgi:outer membrane lipoprotein-sorting protein
MNVTRITTLLIVMTLFLSLNVSAQPVLTGLEAMSRVFERPQPAQLRSTLEMILKNKWGAEQTRKAVQLLGRYDGVEKKILFITSPAIVKNTAFMNFSYSGAENERWIYLPALGMVKRISSGGGDQGFMGSDFAFDDLVQRRPDRDRHTIVRDEVYQGRECHVVESILPEDEASYGRMVTWVADDIWIGLRREFYDRKGVLVKTLEVMGLEQIGWFWTISEMTMTTLKTGHSTTMKLSDLTIDTGLTEDDFTEERMKQGIK